VTDELAAPGEDWEGVYFDGRTSKRHAVRVSRVAEGLLVRGESVGQLLWTHAEMRRPIRIAPDEPARYERGGEIPEVLVISDPSFLPAKRSVFGSRGPDGERRTSGVGRLILPALAVLTGLVLLYLWAVPRMAAVVAERVPLEWEEALGRGVVAAFTSGQRVCEEPARINALNAMVATLTADGRGGRYTYRVTVVDDSIVNALAAPGGEIVLFTGLLAQAASPDELAGVLAHEIQHVVQQHGAKGILRQIPLQLMVMIVSGGEGIATNATQLAARVGGLRYQRGDEVEADQEGMRLLQSARVDPEGMIDFFRKLSAEGRDGPVVLNYLSTHPNSEARMTALSAMANNARYEPVEIVSPQEWRAITAGCAVR
jgi:Zn-dependent protease with chaperone function